MCCAVLSTRWTACCLTTLQSQRVLSVLLQAAGIAAALKCVRLPTAAQVNKLDGLQHMHIPSGQTYKSPGMAYVEGDASSGEGLSFLFRGQCCWAPLSLLVLGVTSMAYVEGDASSGERCR